MNVQVLDKDLWFHQSVREINLFFLILFSGTENIRHNLICFGVIGTVISGNRTCWWLGEFSTWKKALKVSVQCTLQFFLIEECDSR